MKKIILGKSGLEISNVIYGGIVSRNDGQENSDKYVEYAVKNGVNYFDVAPSYGDSQEKMGNSIVPYRKNIHVACKTMERECEGAKRELEASLEMLHSDFIDNYQMHSITTVEEVETAFSKGGAFEVIYKAYQEGTLKHLGITCHSEAAGLRALELFDFETVLFPTNWGLNLKLGFGNKLMAKCKEKNVGILGMKSLIERAWNSQEEKATTQYNKSWCKPIPSEEKEFRIAAMKHAYSMGAMALVPPGNFECFSFAVENSDEILKPLTEEEKVLLNRKSELIEGRCFFNAK